jgi:hypothetical protein
LPFFNSQVSLKSTLRGEIMLKVARNRTGGFPDFRATLAADALLY